MADKSIVGDLINFRGLVYSPVNENGVIFLFGKIADDLNMYIEEIKPGFPDCIGRRFIGNGWERVSIEFEYQSYNFKSHKHDASKCDIIVCWEHNWTDCPIEVIELRSELLNLENVPVKKPGQTKKSSKEGEALMDERLKKISAIPSVKKWYNKIFEGLSELDSSIWAKNGEKYIGWYSPERAFVSVRLNKQSISFECFAGDTSITNTKVCNDRSSPRWAKFPVKADSDITTAIETLKESYKRINTAIKAGQATGYFSGGVYAAGGKPTDQGIGDGEDEA